MSHAVGNLRLAIAWNPIAIPVNAAPIPPTAEIPTSTGDSPFPVNKASRNPFLALGYSLPTSPKTLLKPSTIVIVFLATLAGASESIDSYAIGFPFLSYFVGNLRFAIFCTPIAILVKASPIPITDEIPCETNDPLLNNPAAPPGYSLPIAPKAFPRSVVIKVTLTPNKSKSVSAAIFWNSCKPLAIVINAIPAIINAGEVTYNAAICNGPNENEFAIASNITSILVIALPPPIPKKPLVTLPLSPNNPFDANISAIGSLLNASTPKATGNNASPAIPIAAAPIIINGAAKPAPANAKPTPTITAPIIPTFSQVASFKATINIFVPSPKVINATPATIIAAEPNAIANGIGPIPATPIATASPTITAPIIPRFSQVTPSSAFFIA